jgi:hypothetical protein
MLNFPLLPFLDGEIKLPGSQKDPPLACLLKHWEDLDPESLQQKLLKFYCARPGHNILWEMGKNGQKVGALIIISFFN